MRKLNNKKTFIVKSIIIGVVLTSLILSTGIFAFNIISEKTVNTENQESETLSFLTLKVNIPCSGHAGLIKNELYKAGFSNVNFQPPNYFNIKYDSNKISEPEILSLNIFKQYSAEIVE